MILILKKMKMIMILKSSNDSFINNNSEIEDFDDDCSFVEHNKDKIELLNEETKYIGNTIEKNLINWKNFKFYIIILAFI